MEPTRAKVKEELRPDMAGIESFKANLRGKLISPSDAEYDSARKVYNGMIDKSPRFIARCVDVADVITSVNFARDNNLLLAIRSGGHNGAGLGTCADGLVIDLSPMKGVHVDPTKRYVRVQAGCTWGDVDHATHPFGLAVPSGVISTTGVGGLTLGGGHGYLTRKFGLTIDNLLEAELVLADGRFVVANNRKNQDLYWAIKGGGGNFGVVTSFLFNSHNVKTVYAGPILWNIDQAEDVLRWYREFAPSTSKDMYSFFFFMKVPPAPPFPEQLFGMTVCGVMCCYSGPEGKIEKTFKPIRDFSLPVFEHVGWMPYPTLQSLFDQFYPPGLQWYWKGDFFDNLGDAAIAQHLRFGSQLPTPLSTMHLYQVDGLVHRVARNKTAFNYRNAKWSMVIAGVSNEKADNERITTWAKDYWEALHPYSAGGAYVNFMMEEGQERIEATYRDNYERLREVKKKYDPANLFRVNQNISPGG